MLFASWVCEKTFSDNPHPQINSFDHMDKI